MSFRGIQGGESLCPLSARPPAKTGEHSGLGDFLTVRPKTITRLGGGDAPTHRLSDSIRTASGSDETIAQVSSRICFIRTNRHLTIPRKKTKKKKTPSPIHPEGPEETRTGHRVWMRECWMLTTGRAPVGWRQLQHPGELLTSRSQRLSRLPRVSTNTSVHRLHV